MFFTALDSCKSFVVALPISSGGTDGCLLSEGGQGITGCPSIRINGLFSGPMKIGGPSTRAAGAGDAKAGTTGLTRTGGAIHTGGVVI